MAVMQAPKHTTNGNSRQSNNRKGGPAVQSEGRATQTTPAYDLLLPNEPCFLDIEFQKFKRAGHLKEEARIGRIAFVNTEGDVVLDVFAVYPNEDGVEKRKQPARFGVTGKDLTFSSGAKPADKVEAWVEEIVKGRTVVMHGGKTDRIAFYYRNATIWANSKLADTQDIYSEHQDDGTPGLRTLTENILGYYIQDFEHSPVEDAVATSELYLLDTPYDREVELAKLAPNVQVRAKAAREGARRAAEEREQKYGVKERIMVISGEDAEDWDDYGTHFDVAKGVDSLIEW